MTSIHPHIQIAVAPYGKAALLHIKLVRRNAEVGQNAVHRPRAVKTQVIFKEAEVLVHHRKSGLAVLLPSGLLHIAHGVFVLVKGHQPSFFGKPLVDGL